MMPVRYIVSQEQSKCKFEKTGTAASGSTSFQTGQGGRFKGKRLYLLTRTDLVQVGENRGRLLARATFSSSLLAPEVAVLLLPTLWWLCDLHRSLAPGCAQGEFIWHNNTRVGLCCQTWKWQLWIQSPGISWQL